MATASPTLTRDEIAVVFSREEAAATVEGLKHADATPGIPLRDARHASIAKVQAALAELDKPPPAPEPEPEVKGKAKPHA